MLRTSECEQGDDLGGRVEAMVMWLLQMQGAADAVA
jgi:hypothetical protein